MTIKNLVVTALCLGWLVSGAAMAQGIKPASKVNHWTGSLAPSQEITVEGTVQKIASKPPSGTPAGTHLLLSTDQGTLDASVGPYLAKEVQQNLTSGQPVQIVGLARTSSTGHKYVLVRELVLSGEHISIRNQHGFLVRTKSRNGSQSNRGQGSPIGGIQ